MGKTQQITMSLVALIHNTVHIKQSDDPKTWFALESCMLSQMTH